MPRIGPGMIFFALVIGAGLLFLFQLINASQAHHWLPLDYDGYIVAATKYALEGSFAFGALYLYLPSKTSAETLRKAWTEGLLGVGNDILGRAEAAREAVETLAQVGRTTPDQLPVACTLEFSEVAAYCAGWRTRERRHYWHRPLSDMFETSNRALFDFILTLEISKCPDFKTLEDKQKVAALSLEAVIAELRRTLQIPNT
jgi:hypothetical protein